MPYTQRKTIYVEYFPRSVGILRRRLGHTFYRLTPCLAPPALLETLKQTISSAAPTCCTWLRNMFGALNPTSVWIAANVSESCCRPMASVWHFPAMQLEGVGGLQRPWQPQVFDCTWSVADHQAHKLGRVVFFSEYRGRSVNNFGRWTEERISWHL